MGLSLLVILSVFWRLKLTGITLADEAFCGNEEHIHGEECREAVQICGLEESEDHSHTDECYVIQEICTLGEHIHTPQCYSDINADLETADDWEMSLAELIRSSVPGENVASVARSQLGCAESLRNFQVDANGVFRGITRYGQWYGNPYGSWSAMFACFCLDYAGIIEAPLNAGPESMRAEWENANLYAEAGTVEPHVGDLLFLDKDGSGTADAVAIVTSVEGSTVFTIEGDVPRNDLPVETDAAAASAGLFLTEEVSTETFTEEPTEAPAESSESAESPETELQAVAETAETPVPDVVAQTRYDLQDPAVMGIGLIPMEGGPAILPAGDPCTVWFDGTLGGLKSMGGSPNTSQRTVIGATLKLPTSWTSPEKYSYTLKGWYDVTNNKYYAPGAEVEVTGNMVFYPDWIAASYDVGQFNSQVTNTVSTSEFVTVRMFDYNFLFNVLSSRADVRFTQNSHTETWRLLTSGNNPYNGQPTLNYIFRDWDKGSEDISYPNGVGSSGPQWPTDAGSVYPGLYNNRIADLLFNPNTEVIGKEYLGTGDHLFQLCLDPAHDHYGYYYYNSERNAASYSKSDQRFYVYNYLERTLQSSSETEGTAGKYSDFLPLNSPYVNNNGKSIKTYTYDGVEGEYRGTTHYTFDHEYDSGNSSPNNAGTNFLFGMTMDVAFYLPNAPGSGGNQDVFGKEMHFKFSGDDDVWVFIDGKLVLDLGGIHGMESGDINFSTGTVTVNGTVNNNLSNTLKSLGAGEHTLTLYYLERGSSMSNCSIYFNLAPRFSFSIQKEDVLTRNVLNGAQFSVYTDRNCTIPAELWTSKESHDRGDPSTNVFTVTDGEADMWGMGAGNTYYIKETRGPDNQNYEGIPNGIIELTFDHDGTASYNVEILDNGSGVSPGFTVHGFRIDAETQKSYIVATNAPKWVKETTSVQVNKQWEDAVNHSADSITVYLTVTNQDGTVQRLQEVKLNESNNWQHEWDNLPKFWEDGTPIRYGVEEAYIPGYYNRIEKATSYENWVSGTAFENGKTYLIQSSQGFLSTQNRNSDTGFQWVNQAAAEGSDLAQWTATVTNSGTRLTNKAGQALTFYYNGGSSGYPTDFYASTGGESNQAKQYFRTTSASGGLRLYYDGGDGRDYYLISSMTSSQKFQYSTTSRNGLILTPMYKEQFIITAEVAYQITNTPLEQETHLTVEKHWDYGNLPPGKVHEQLRITVKLLANGKDTGRSLTLTYQEGWKGSFQGLPYVDENDEVIVYTVAEVVNNPDWIPVYGPVTTSPGRPPTYSATVTNRYRLGMGGPMLPSTGTAARTLYILCGGSIMLTSLVYGILSRRKRERRMK